MAYLTEDEKAEMTEQCKRLAENPTFKVGDWRGFGPVYVRDKKYIYVYSGSFWFNEGLRQFNEHQAEKEAKKKAKQIKRRIA